MNEKRALGRRNRGTLRAATLALCFTAAALASSPAWAADGQATTREFDRLIDQALAQEDPAAAMARVFMLPRLRRYVPTEHVARRLEQAAGQTKHPQVRAMLERQLEQARRELGDWSNGPDAMKGPVGAQGCLVDFTYVGPFENDSMEGFFSALPPENGEAGPYGGKVREIDWRALPRFQQLCTLNLDAALEPEDQAVVFLANTIEAPTARPGRLLLGANGNYKVWLNGELVAAREENSGLAPDNDAWTIELDAGKNELLIKLASGQSTGLDLTARLVGEDLAPMADLTVTPKWGGSPVKKAGEAKPEPTAEGMIARARALAKSAPGAQALWAAWLWSGVEYRNAGTPWRDVAERIDDAAASGELSLSPTEYIVLAELFEEHWKRLELLERAREKHPDDPWVAFRLADEYERSLNQRHQLARRELLEALVREHPDFAPAHVELASWWRGEGFEEHALRMLLASASPERRALPAFSQSLLGVLEASNRDREARELRAQLAKTAAISANVAWHEIKDLTAQGKYDAALALVRVQRQRAPWSTHWLLKEVDLHHARGDLDAALAALDARLAITPDEVRAWRKKAELLIARGDDEAAAEALEAALEIRPQDQELRDFIAHLRPSANRFHEPWMRDDLRELSQRTDAGPFHSTSLVDQVIVRVASNGLAQRVVQRVERVNTPEGVDDASVVRVNFQLGDERVDILRVRVHKADGSISEDYDTWRSDGSRKASTTYNDNGHVTIRANNVEPGDVVEFRWRLSQIANKNFRGDYFGDIEYIQGTEPIAFARYAVLSPKDWGELYYRPPALEHRRVDGKLPDGSAPPEGWTVTSFELEDVPYVKTDPDQPGYTDVYDYILVSNKATYDEIGAWWWNLVKEQLIVDENIRETVARLTKGLPDDDARVRAIHNYVVQNTRYLHVGLGIHGWKPYRTTTCLRNRYGDCKDKAALLKVMLEEAGVEANLVLVRTRRLGTVDDEPASMHIFNHAIAYVPSMDLFLDGTAEFNGTRELTPMDQGAQALIVKDGGATEWVTLPVDEADDNLLVQELTVDLTGEEPTTTARLVAHGANAVYYRSALEDPERRDELLEKQLSNRYPGAKLVRANYSDLTRLEQPVEITATFTGGRMVRESDTRKFVYPMGAPKKLLSAYAKQARRDQDLTIRVPFANKTTMRYRLPAGAKPARLPKPQHIKSEFGAVDIEYTQRGGELVVEVRYSLDVQRVSAEDYPRFREFMSEATSRLNETITLEE